MNSKNKGKRGELQVAKMLRDQGLPARRGQQYCGIEGVDVAGPEGYHFEVKWVEKLNVYGAMKQALEDARPGEVPVVAHKKNREEWLATMRLADLIELIKEVGNHN